MGVPGEALWVKCLRLPESGLHPEGQSVLPPTAPMLVFRLTVPGWRGLRSEIESTSGTERCKQAIACCGSG